MDMLFYFDALQINTYMKPGCMQLNLVRREVVSGECPTGALEKRRGEGKNSIGPQTNEKWTCKVILKWAPTKQHVQI